MIVLAADGQLLLRAGDFDFHPIPGSRFAVMTSPVFSPDSRSIAFFADGALKTIPVNGGTPTTLVEIDTPLGMTWRDKNQILIGQGSGGIVRVSVPSGMKERIVTVGSGELAHGPQALPEGDAILFTLAKNSASPRWDEADAVVQRLGTNSRITVAKGADARSLASGHLVYVLAGTIYAKRFNTRTLVTSAEAVPVLPGVRRATGGVTGTAQFSVSETGSLVYIPGPSAATSDRTLILSTTDGVTAKLPLAVGEYKHPRASRDGKRIAYGVDDLREANIWVLDDLSGGTAARKLTFDGKSRFPVWVGNDRIAYQSDMEGRRGIAMQPVGGGAVEQLTKAGDDERHIPESFSPERRVLLFSVEKKGAYSLYYMTLADKKPQAFGDVRSSQPIEAAFSPDGQWVAYGFVELTGESRSNRGVWVQPFPATGSKYPLPKVGRDYHPTWSPDSNRLFFVPGASSDFFSVEFKRRPGISFGNPKALSNVPRPGTLSNEPRNYDVLPDGRFICSVSELDRWALGFRDIRVVINWFEDLRRLVPDD